MSPFRLFERARWRWWCAAALLLALARPAGTQENPVPLNVAQYKGSHNSYERKEFVADQLARHRIRQLEFDVRFINGEWVVYHDERGSYTSCYYLAACLQSVRDWSEAHPGHQAVYIWIDLKDRAWAPGGMEELDKVVTGHLGARRLFTPDDLRRDHTDLQTALAKSGWPDLRALRNRFVVVLTGNGAMNDAYALSTTPALRGRPAFVNFEPNRPTWDFADPQDPLRVPYRVIFNLNLGHPVPPWRLDFIRQARARGFLTRGYNLAHRPDTWATLKEIGLNILSSDWVDAEQYPYAVVGNPLGCHHPDTPCDPKALAEPPVK